MEINESWFGEPNWHWRMWMFIRSIAGCTNLFLHYTAVKYISLADTTIICLATPVVAFIFGRIFLKEPFGRWHVLALCISTIGVALASKEHTYIGNGTLFSSNTTEVVNIDSYEYPKDPSTRRLIGIGYCLGSVFVASIVMVALRKVSF